MNNFYKHTLGILGLLFLASGCGENFQAVYKGQASVGDLCNAAGTASGQYNIEGRLQISGGDASFLVTSMTRVGTNETPYGSELGRYKVDASFNDTSFYRDYQGFSDSEDFALSASADVSPDRSEITNFRYALDRKQADGSVCRFSMQSTGKLTRAD